MDTQTQGPLPLVSDNDIAMVTANMPSRFLAKITTTLLRGWRDKYEAKLAEYQGVFEHYIRTGEETDAQIAQLAAENARLVSEAAGVTLDDVLTDVVAWGKLTFPDGTDYGIITHMSRELRELVQAPDDGEEMADILILLSHLAAYHGVDLKGEVIAKMIINRQREWGQPDEAGVIEHRRTSKEGA